MPPDSFLAFVEKGEWMQQANCRGVDPELFFPERGESTKEAKDICHACSVKRMCLEYGVQRVEKFGIWGGMSERERRRVRKMRRQKLKTSASSDKV